MIIVSLLVGVALLFIGLLRPQWLLLAFTFLAPIIPMNVGYSILGEHGMTVSPARLIAVLFLVAFGIRAVLGPVPSGFRLAIPFLLYIGVRLAGLLVAPDKVGGAILLAGEYGALTALLSYGAFCVIRRPSDLDRLITVALLAAVIAGSIGMWEWATGRYFGATEIVRRFTAVTPLSETIAMKTEGLKRITGPFAHSLIMAGFLAFLVPVCMQRAGVRRGIGRAVQYGTLAMLVVPLLLTFGRAALIVTVAEALAVVKLSHGRKVWPMALGIVLITICMMPIYASYRSPGEETSLLVPKAQVATFARRYGQLASDFTDDPIAALLGFGWGRNDLSGIAPRGEQSWRWAGMDSDFERVLGTTGIVGFATWLALFFCFAWEVRRSARARRRVVWETPAGAVVVGVIGAIVQAIPGASILTYSQTLPIVGICMGASLGVLQEDLRQSVSAFHADPAVSRAASRYRVLKRRIADRASGYPSLGRKYRHWRDQHISGSDRR